MKPILITVAAIAVPILAGCAGTTLDAASIMALSTPEVLAPEVRSAGLENLELPEQSAINVKVFEKRPEFAYFVVDTFHTTFEYLKDSVTYRKIEKKEHLKKLRARAGKLGANGLIVVYGRKETSVGGATNYDMLASQGSGGVSGSNNPTQYAGTGGMEVVSSDKESIVQVTSYAIYRRLD
jgi:hypothetical protein